jgi:hypothetical protein
MLLATDDAFDGASLTGEVFQRLGIDPDASRYLALPGRTPDGQDGRHGDFPARRVFASLMVCESDRPVQQKKRAR